MSYRSDVLKQLDTFVPTSTRDLMRKNKVYYNEKTRGWINNEAFEFIQGLWKMEEDGLIEHVDFTGWILKGENDADKDL